MHFNYSLVSTIIITHKRSTVKVLLISIKLCYNYATRYKVIITEVTTNGRTSFLHRRRTRVYHGVPGKDTFRAGAAFTFRHYCVKNPTRLKVDRDCFYYTDSLDAFLAKRRKSGPHGPRKVANEAEPQQV